MQLFLKRKIIFLLLLFVFSLGMIGVKASYSALVDVPIKEEYQEQKQEEVSLTNEKIFSFLESVSVPVLEEAEVEEESIPVEPQKEDPLLLLKKQEGEKGVAKSSTLEEAKEKYESNETSLGIDVSTYQGKIDWKKVKESGIHFAMIRCGFRGYETGKIVKDNRFEDNIKGAIANGIHVGVYFFSSAINAYEAKEEAEWTLEQIANYDISFPVAIDTEIFDYRLAGVPYSVLTQNAIVFSDTVKSRGYTPMIYSYAKAFTNYFDTAKFAPYRIWLAQFNDTVTYKGKYHIWQYTSNGSVSGISGRVDMNVAYFSITSDASKQASVSGISPNSLPFVSFKELYMETTLNKEVILRTSPHQNVPNKAGTLPAGASITVTGLSESYVRFLYNGNLFYVPDTDCFTYHLPEVSFNETNMKVKTNKEVILLSSPYSFLNNEVKVLDKDTIVQVVGVHSEYTKVKVQDEIYYIYDVDFYDVLSEEKRGSSS